MTREELLAGVKKEMISHLTTFKDDLEVVRRINAATDFADIVKLMNGYSDTPIGAWFVVFIEGAGVPVSVAEEARLLEMFDD